MPIKPENKKRYPANWKQISEEIRFNRANNRCEVCGIENHTTVHSFTENGETVWRPLDIGEWYFKGCPKTVKVILTVAHLDHQPENCDPGNLKAMCQKCHNSYDRKHRDKTIKNTKLIGQTEIRF